MKIIKKKNNILQIILCFLMAKKEQIFIRFYTRSEFLFFLSVGKLLNRKRDEYENIIADKLLLIFHFYTQSVCAHYNMVVC